MYIKDIEINNFRNHEYKKISLKNGINFFYGKNAVGKTNIIEAIYFLATTKSFRTTRENECIKENEKKSQIIMKICKKEGKIDLKFEIDTNNKKIFYCNSEKFTKLGNFFGNFQAVLFTPDLMKILKDGPEERRNFIDSDITQISGIYYELLNRYEKVLLMRNKLLKKKSGLSEIDVFNYQLASYASKIIVTRKKFIDKINPYANQNMQNLTKNKESLELIYDTKYNGTTDEIRDNIIKDLENYFEKDYEIGHTTIGPHREDIKIISNGKDMRIFGSQGQQRTALLAIKLSECNIFESETGEKPVLLLDDVFSELDTNRAKKLFECSNNIQTIITGTRLRKTNIEYNKIKI